MKYTDPGLRDLLAGHYVLDALPRRARARFERLMARDEGLVRLVDDWRARLAPLDETATPIEPPARVWRAIERAIGPAPTTATVTAHPAIAPSTMAPSPTRRPIRPASPPWWDRIGLWRGLTVGSLALAASLVAFIVGTPVTPPIAPQIVSVLADTAGTASFVATAERQTIKVAAIRPQALAADKSFELWSIAGGPPRSLGVIAPTADRPLVLARAMVPAEGVFAITLEPSGGSPTGGPTGPVVYQGRILAFAQ